MTDKDERIWQITLAEYRSLSQQKQSADRKLKRLRAILAPLISAGVPVQAGPLTCWLETRDQPIYSRPTLVDALGQDLFDELRPRFIRPVQYLYVRPTARRVNGARVESPNPFV